MSIRDLFRASAPGINKLTTEAKQVKLAEGDIKPITEMPMYGEMAYAMRKYDSDDLNFDTVASKQGIETYFDMEFDPQVRLCRKTRDNILLSGGWKIKEQPDVFDDNGEPIKGQISDEQKRAIEFLYWNLEYGLDEKFTDTLRKMLDAPYIGFSLIEKIMDVCKKQEYGGLWYYKGFKDIDQRMIGFRRDDYGRLTTIYQNQNSQTLSGYKLEPISKFVLWTYPYVMRQNYYGTGDYAAAYPYWIVKKKMQTWRASYGEKMAIQRIIALVQKEGTAETDKVLNNIRKALAGAITTLAKDNIASKEDIFSVPIPTDSGFWDAWEIAIDKQIAKAMGFLSHILDADNGTFNLADKRSDQLMVTMTGDKTSLEGKVNTHIIAPILGYNFLNLRRLPLFELNLVTDEKPKDKSDRFKIDVESGILDPRKNYTDMEFCREQLGYPAIGDKINEATIAEDGTEAPGDITATPIASGEKGGAQVISTTTENVLNGAQITAAVDIIQSVVNGTIPRETGIQMLINFFNIKPEVAEKLMGAAGTTTPTTANPIQGGEENPEVSPVEDANKPPESTKPKKPGDDMPNEENAAYMESNGAEYINKLLKLQEKHPRVNFIRLAEQMDDYEGEYVRDGSGVVLGIRDSMLRQYDSLVGKYGLTYDMFNTAGEIKIKLNMFNYQNWMKDIYYSGYLIGKVNVYDEADTAKQELKLAEITIPVKPLPHEEALKYFKKKVAMPKDQIKAIDKQSFTIAGNFEKDVIKKAQNIISTGISTGNVEGTKFALKKLYDEYLAPEDLGKSIGSQWHINTIIRTNYSDAYNQGRMEQYNEPEILETLTGYTFEAVLDDRTSAFCEFHNGEYLDKDDPRLKEMTPPAHHQCRSILIAIYNGETAEKQWRPGSETAGTAIPAKGFTTLAGGQ